MEESVKGAEGCASIQEESRDNTGADGLRAEILAAFPGKQQDIRTYSPLALA